MEMNPKSSYLTIIPLYFYHKSFVYLWRYNMIVGTAFFISFLTSLIQVYIYTHNTMKYNEFLHQSSGINMVSEPSL